MKAVEIKYKIVCGSKRAYPVNHLSYLFLDLIRARNSKTFTSDQLFSLKKIAEILDFEVVES